MHLGGDVLAVLNHIGRSRLFDLALVVPRKLTRQALDLDLAHGLGKVAGNVGAVGRNIDARLVDGLDDGVDAIVGVGGKLVGRLVVGVLIGLDEVGVLSSSAENGVMSSTPSAREVSKPSTESRPSMPSVPMRVMSYPMSLAFLSKTDAGV